MRVIHSFVSVGALTLASVLACNGQLVVGADEGNAGAPGDDGTVGAGGSGALFGSGGTPSAAGGTSSGGSGSGGFASGGSSGSGGVVVLVADWTEGIDPTPAVPGSSEDCPSGPLLDDSDCESVGLVCGYKWDATNYEECVCIRAGQTGTWTCNHFGADNLEFCPDEMPEQGVDCFGYIGLTCVYPPGLIECYCNGTDEYLWDCPMPEYRTLSDPPSPPDPSKAVQDLTDAEREAWCEWYSMESSGGPGHPPVPDRMVNEAGYVIGGGCQANPNPPCRATMPILSVEQCMQNLALSECESPLSKLSACAANVHSGKCAPTDEWCPEYLLTPGCEGTLVLEYDGGQCAVRVE